MIATRGQLLGLILVAVLAGGAWLTLYRSNPPERERATAARSLPEVSRAAPRASPSLLDALGRRPRASEPGVDLFGARTWSAPPGASPKVGAPAVVAPQESTVPVVPPVLPFMYMGRLVSGDERMLFVASGDLNLVLREGDVAEALYRLDRIEEVEAVFTHLQAGVQLRLPFHLEPMVAGGEGRGVAAAASPVQGEPGPAAAAGLEDARQTGGVRDRAQRANQLAARAAETSEELASEAAAAATARRARAIRAIAVEPWVCTAQQANELRTCDARPPVEGSDACKQAAASRYRACLGGALRSAQRSALEEEE
jgi:hypothetical protein